MTRRLRGEVQICGSVPCPSCPCPCSPVRTGTLSAVRTIRTPDMFSRIDRSRLCSKSSSPISMYAAELATRFI